MTDIETPSTATTPAKPAFGWTKRLMISTAMTLSLAGLGTAAVYARDMHRKDEAGQHQMNDRAEFMEFRLQKMLDRVDATDDQKTRLTALFEKTREAMKPPAPPASPEGAENGPGRGGPGIGGPGMDGPLPREIIAELARPTIDKAAIEKLRAEKVADMDSRSRVLTAALVKAAEILTPEQREKLADEMAKHGGMRMGMGKGHHKR